MRKDFKVDVLPKCRNCGAEFTPNPENLGPDPQVYCSRRCGRRAQDKRRNNRRRQPGSHKYEQDRNRRAKRRAEIVAYVRNIKAAGCSRCSEKRYYCLDFHHMNPEEKEFSIGHMFRKAITGPTFERIKKEIAKCILLCANCHRAEEWEKKNAAILAF